MQAKQSIKTCRNLPLNSLDGLEEDSQWQRIVIYWSTRGRKVQIAKSRKSNFSGPYNQIYDNNIR
jgi:hypothetical protein